MTETDVEIKLEACNRSAPANIPMVVIENYTSPRNIQSRRQMKVNRGMVVNALYKTHDWIYVRNYDNESQEKQESQSLHRNYLRKSTNLVSQTRSLSEMGRAGYQELQKDLWEKSNFSRQFYSLRIPGNVHQDSLHNFHRHLPMQHTRLNNIVQPSQDRHPTTRAHRQHGDPHLKSRSDIHPFTKTGRFPSKTEESSHFKRAYSVRSQPPPLKHSGTKNPYNSVPFKSKVQHGWSNTSASKLQSVERSDIYFPQDISTLGHMPNYLKSPLQSPVQNLSFSSSIGTEDRSLVSLQDMDDTPQLTVIFDYNAKNENDVSVSSNEVVNLLNDSDPEWLWVRTEYGKEGFIPRTHVVNLRQFNLDPWTKTTYC